VVPSAAALAVPVERGQERGQSGGTGSDFSVFRHNNHPFQVRLEVEDDGVSSRFVDFIPIGNFLVKTHRPWSEDSVYARIPTTRKDDGS
jgi:hypothetical protein